MMAAFVLDTMPVNAAFQSALSSDIGLTSGVVVWGAVSYNGRSYFLRVGAISIETGVRFGWSASRSCSASCSCKRRSFAAHTSNMEFSSFIEARGGYNNY
ncbi:hypothetical protein TNCV_1081211 [Trichonephila clavipes]|nr:hypothetical protein TNCV_1081211 [Trichonephila clavipes]